MELQKQPQKYEAEYFLINIYLVGKQKKVTTKGSQSYLNDKKNETAKLLDVHNESLSYYLSILT